MTDRRKQKLITAVLLLFGIAIITASSVLLHLYIEEKRENGELDRQLLQLREENASMQTIQENLYAENKEMDAMIEQMIEELASRDSLLNQSEADMNELNTLIQQIRTEISEKEAEAAELEKKIAELEQENEISLLISEKMRESRNAALAEAEQLKRRMDVLLAAADPEPEETESESPEEDGDVDEIEEPQTELTGTVQVLLELLETGAPDRYVKAEDGNIYSEYPWLEYAYYDFTTGKSVTYCSDEIIYSASVIKAPYIYAVIREIENFEKNKRDYDSAGNSLWDEEGNPVFDGSHPNYDGDGNLVYLPGEEKYNLDEIWTFDPETMMEEGSGEIMSKPAGFQLTWRELIEYSLLYSDNIAFAQIRQRFGYTSFYQLVGELGIQGTATGFMNLSADDCIRFLTVMYDYMASGSDYALWMKDCMVRSKHSVILARNYPEGICAHKYGWDIDAYHDAAVIFDEHPYALVVMSNLHDGGDIVNAFFGEIAELTKQIHAEQYSDK